MKRLIPKKNMPYFSNSIYELYEVSETWLEELTFIEKEQDFFREILTNYVMDECSEDCYKQGKFLLNGIMNEQQLGEELHTEINEHKMDLGLLIEKIYLKREDQFRERHLALKENVTNYVKNYKFLKEKLFALILKVLRLKKENIKC